MRFEVYFKDDKPYRVYIGKSKRDEMFKKENTTIIVVIKGSQYYTRLPNSFFNKCPHLDTAYNNANYKGENELIKWLKDDKVKSVNIETIEDYKKFRLVKFA